MAAWQRAGSNEKARFEPRLAESAMRTGLVGAGGEAHEKERSAR
ncbi:hypothetical protein [Streptomyces oceani]|nr:hypothetical protein [Streptomyces oceani]